MTKGVQNNVVPQSYPVCWMKDTDAWSPALLRNQFAMPTVPVPTVAFSLCC
jgi:hypothetical protein